MSIERFIKKICVQTAVYWGNPTPDGYGKMTYDPPVEIKCRWEQKMKTITTGNGDQIICNAIILVTQDLDDQGVLFLGELDELTSAEETNPLLVIGAYEDSKRAYTIKRIDKVPMIKSTSEFIRTVYL
jgi:hypothetical protein